MRLSSLIHMYSDVNRRERERDGLKAFSYWDWILPLPNLETIPFSPYCLLITSLQKPWDLYGSQVPECLVFIHPLTVIQRCLGTWWNRWSKLPPSLSLEGQCPALFLFKRYNIITKQFWPVENQLCSGSGESFSFSSSKESRGTHLIIDSKHVWYQLLPFTDWPSHIESCKFQFSKRFM